MSEVPLIIPFEGTVVAGATIYTYVSSVALNITASRVLSRDGAPVNIEVRKNGVLLDVLEVTSPDTGVVSVPNLYFGAGDELSLRTPTTTINPLEGITIFFTCTVQDGQDDSELTQSQQIQTPLLARYEGTLVNNELFFRSVPVQRVGLFRYTILLRNPADADVHINVMNGGVVIGQLVLPSGQTTVTALLGLYFNAGEELTLRITQTGTTDVGGSMLVILDYRNVSQTDFSSFQTPWIVEYEGLGVTASSEVLYYVVPRGMTLAAIQLFVRDVSASQLQLGIFRNGVIQSAITLTAGNQRTTPNALSIVYTTGDLLEVRALTAIDTSAILVTLDYFISVGDNTPAFRYYSDPIQDIVILARQLGIGGKKADALPLEKLDKYQRDVDNIINGRLRSIYRTPLVKIPNGGNNPWPGAIQVIAQRLVLSRLLNDVYTEVEPNAVANVANNGNLAEEDLGRLWRKENILEGQRMRPRNCGSNPFTEPLTQPQSSMPTQPQG